MSERRVALPIVAHVPVVLGLVSSAAQVVLDPTAIEQDDAQKVVEAFGARIRNGSDPQTAGTDLATAISRTLQPSTIGLWSPEVTR